LSSSAAAEDVPVWPVPSDDVQDLLLLLPLESRLSFDTLLFACELFPVEALSTVSRKDPLLLLEELRLEAL
jgi:hypothetical protein